AAVDVLRGAVPGALDAGGRTERGRLPRQRRAAFDETNRVPAVALGRTRGVDGLARRGAGCGAVPADAGGRGTIDALGGGRFQRPAHGRSPLVDLLLRPDTPVEPTEPGLGRPRRFRRALGGGGVARPVSVPRSRALSGPRFAGVVAVRL